MMAMWKTWLISLLWSAAVFKNDQKYTHEPNFATIFIDKNEVDFFAYFQTLWRVWIFFARLTSYE